MENRQQERRENGKNVWPQKDCGWDTVIVVTMVRCLRGMIEQDRRCVWRGKGGWDEAPQQSWKMAKEVWNATSKKQQGRVVVRYSYWINSPVCYRSFSQWKFFFSIIINLLTNERSLAIHNLPSNQVILLMEIQCSFFFSIFFSMFFSVSPLWNLLCVGKRDLFFAVLPSWLYGWHVGWSTTLFQTEYLNNYWMECYYILYRLSQSTGDES